MPTMPTIITLPTVLVPIYGSNLLYFANPRPSPNDVKTINQATTSIWKQLTGRKTIRPNDIGLIADLTQGLVRIENPLK